MCATLDDTTSIQNKNLVRVLQREKTVSDHEGCTSFHRSLQRLLNLELCFGIDTRRSVVQDQNLRIHHQGSGNGHALLLTTRKRDASLANHRIVAIRQRRDVVMDPGCFRGRDDGLFSRFRPSIGNVLADGIGEEERVLQHHPYLTTQILERYLANVDAVHQDRSIGNVIEAWYERRDCALTRSGPSNERDALAGIDREGDVGQSVFGRVEVAEADVLELDATVDLAAA